MKPLLLRKRERERKRRRWRGEEFSYKTDEEFSYETDEEFNHKCSGANDVGSLSRQRMAC